MIILELAARKVRVNITDQSGLVLQSLGQLNEKSNPGQLQLVHNSNVRRFSTVEKQPEDSLSNSDIIPKFSSSVFQPTFTLPNLGQLSTDNTSSNNSTDMLTDTSESRRGMTHAKSSPHLSVLPSLLGSPQTNLSEGSAVTSQNMHINESHRDLLEATKTSSGNTVNKSIMSSALPSSDAQRPIESNQYGTNSIGFGILSRTRQFGAWLTKATEGGRLEITKQDLNALAPNSF